MAQPAYYSMRRLAPYRGTVQVVHMPGFRALSVDGYQWQVKVDTRDLPGRGVDNKTRGMYGYRATSGVIYGTWSRDCGKSFIKTRYTEMFVRALENHPPLPFPAADKLELWLLDVKRQLPLTLLSTALPHISPPKIEDVIWRTLFVGDRDFISPTLAQKNTVDSKPRFLPLAHSDVLRRCVRAAAGPRPQAQWFLRDKNADGEGFSSSGVGGPFVGRRLSQHFFPELLISEECWETERERNLVRDYHHWQAPNLLTHHGLNRETRDRLEHRACEDAERLYSLRRVLPARVNKDLINTAFVKAMIKKSAIGFGTV